LKTLIVKIINNIQSSEFKNAVKLGDDNSKTLGFLPYVAFEKYSKQNQLFGVFDNSSNELYGYLLYRISFNKVTIVHCCINSNHRNKNIAKILVDYLKKITKQYDGIKLSCRNDYKIDHVWESFNFVPVKEKKGRSKKGLPLTVWWYPHHQTDLLSLISDYELNNKIVAVIDTNIFIDIKDEREQESLALNSDWLLSEAILYVTREIQVEINRAKTLEIKESSRKLLSFFKVLPFRNEAEFKKILTEIQLQFPEKNKTQNDKSDLNHLAYSIVAGAEYFITRDQNLLNSKTFFKKYNLMIYRPSEFISRLDENMQTAKYKPQQLIGTSISSKRITAKNIDDYVSLFLNVSEKKTHFQKIIRNSLSFPKKFELLTVSKKQEVLAFIILDRTHPNKLRIPLLRFLKSSLKNTLSKYLLYKAMLSAISEKRFFVEITEEYLDNDLINTIREARFEKIENKWLKLNLQGILKKKSLAKVLGKTTQDNTLLITKLIDKITNKKEFQNSETIKTYNIERHLAPLKIEDLDIATFIVPIKPQWAEVLFNDNSKEKLPLYEPDYELLLNSENIYYRSAIPKILESPSRILWYSSENKSTGGKGKIIASSYIDEVFIDTPKKLYKQFEQLGIYTWDQVYATAGKKDNLMAFVFSDTELFKEPVSLFKINNLFKEKENKNFMVAAPIKIQIDTYLAIYKLGMQL